MVKWHVQAVISPYAETQGNLKKLMQNFHMFVYLNYLQTSIFGLVNNSNKKSRLELGLHPTLSLGLSTKRVDEQKLIAIGNRFPSVTSTFLWWYLMIGVKMDLNMEVRSVTIGVNWVKGFRSQGGEWINQIKMIFFILKYLTVYIKW